MKVDVNPTDKENVWQADLIIPTHLWREFQEWREDMRLPEAKIWLTGSGKHFAQVINVSEKQAMLFKLRWA